MTIKTDSTEKEFCVVLNDEEQYSVWSSDRPLPKGWRKHGFEGSKEGCLSQIKAVWTDIRPLSLRRRLKLCD